MNKRRLERTGHDVSELVLGGGMVGGILILPDLPMRRAALERIVAAGVNWIDTAPSYGNGTSEETIGQLLPDLPAKPHISTKFTLQPADETDIDGAIERSLTRSLTRLRMSRVELLQLHNQISPGGAPRTMRPGVLLRARGVADVLDDLKRQGMIGAFGITAAGHMPSVLQVIDSGRFDTAQVYYNMINPSAAWTKSPGQWTGTDLSGLMDACKRQSMGMLNIRVFAGGPLVSPTRHGREYVMMPEADLASEDFRASRIWEVLGSKYGTRAQAALRFALGNTDFACSVVGINNLAQLEEAIAACEMGPLPDDAIEKLNALHQSDFRTS